MSTGRIPHALPAFNIYIGQVQNYINTIRLPDLQKRGLMLGLTAPQIAAVVAQYGTWFTGNPASPGLWELHTNAYTATKTKTTRAKVVMFMKNFNILFEPMLNIMAASTACDALDKNMLNITISDGDHDTRGAITQGLVLMLKSAGGNEVEYEARISGDSSRPSLDPLADGIEISFKIGGSPPPASAIDCTYNKVKKKAKGKLDTFPGQAGQRIYAFVRSVNLTDDGKSGPESAVATCIIQG